MLTEQEAKTRHQFFVDATAEIDSRFLNALELVPQPLRDALAKDYNRVKVGIQGTMSTYIYTQSFNKTPEEFVAELDKTITSLWDGVDR